MSFDESIYNLHNLSVGRLETSSNFELSQEGIYEVTLTDFDFPDSFLNIGVSIYSFSDGEQRLASIWQEGRFTFEAMAPGTYRMNLTGELLGSFGMGMYGVSVAQFSASTAVPVPPALLLLASALMFMLAYMKRIQRKTQG